MQLTTKGRYAVMALLDLAFNSNSVKEFESQISCSLQDIAKRQEVSFSYLEQLFSKLKKAGLVNSVRGAKGGYVLAKNPENITIFEIISASEENIKMTRCGSSDHNGCMSSKEQCITHELWAGLEENIQNYFKNITLAKLIKNNSKTSAKEKYDFLNNADIIQDFQKQTMVG